MNNEDKEDTIDEIDQRLGDPWSMTDAEYERLWKRSVVVLVGAALVGLAIWATCWSLN